MEVIQDDALSDSRRIIFGRIHERVLILFDCNEVWRNADLSLEQLVEELNTNRTYLTLYFKYYHGCNFRTLINRYRLKESIRLLEVKTNFTISAIAHEVGFSSISTFNTLFKVKVGCTPSDYCRERLKQPTDIEEF